MRVQGRRERRLRLQACLGRFALRARSNVATAFLPSHRQDFLDPMHLARRRLSCVQILRIFIAEKLDL
jgi:hypothetical protein